MSQVTPADVGRISLFAGLPDADLRAIAEAADRRQLGDGEILFEEGRPADTLHAIVGGGLVIRANVDGRSVIVESVGPGEIVGWSSIREGAVSLATARATGPTEVITIPADRVVELAAGGSAQSSVLVRRIVGLAARHLDASWNQLLRAGSEGVITGG